MPKLEAALRHDAGDAETGFGLDVGGGFVLANRGTGLRAEVSGRTLVAHEDGDFRDWGVSASVHVDPAPESALGPSLSLRHALGAASSGGPRALFDRTTMAGLADGGAGSGSRLELEAAYGLPVLDGRYVGAPHAGVALSGEGRVWTLGWRLQRPSGVGVRVGIAATRTEPEDAAAASVDAFKLMGEVRW